MARQRLIAYCDGGLGNRLNALIGALYFARALDLEASVSWPINRWCAAPFEDLFEAPYPVDRRSMPEIDAQCRDHLLLAHERQAFSLPALLDPRVLLPGKLLADLRAALGAAGGLVYYNNLVPPYIRSSEIDAIVRTIVVRSEYKQLANDYLSRVGLQPRRYWGLHLRGTDAGFSARYYAFWYRMCRLLPGPIVLCTDDKAVEDRFLHNPAIVRRSTSALPGKAEEGRGWNDALKDEYGRELAYNIYRGADAVRESMIDFEILGQSRALRTSRSTFLENARRFGGPVPPWAWFTDTVAWCRYAWHLARA